MTQIAPPSQFPDVKPFPGTAAPPPMGHNRPPPEEMVVIEFNEAIDAKEGFRDLHATLIDKGKFPPKCADDDMAGRLGDFIKRVNIAKKFIDETHSKIKGPYLAAVRAIDGVKGKLSQDLDEAKRVAQAKLDAYMAEKAQKEAAEQRRIAAEQARMRQEAADRAAEAQRIENERAATEYRAVEVAPEPEPPPPAAPVISTRAAAPVAVRSDMGAHIGTKKVWKHEVASVRGLGNDILNHPAVTEAIDKVIAGRIRSGEREIKGVRIWDEQVANVR